MSECLFLAGTWNYREAGGRSGTKCDTFFLYQDHGIKYQQLVYFHHF